MNNLEELKSVCEKIEKEIWSSYVDENGKAEPIIDGIVDIEQYIATEPKILWILKEPYDDVEDGFATGGGWHFSRDFLARKDFRERMGHSKNTWHPIIYVSYGIINGFKEWDDMKYIKHAPEMIDIIKQIAIINVKKLPGFTRTHNFGVILNSYNEHKDILHNQIEQYNPDIIIGGSTMHLFYNELGISQNEVNRNNSIDYVIKENKLFIAAYHPGQTQVKREIYVNEIISISREFWLKK